MNLSWRIDIQAFAVDGDVLYIDEENLRKDWSIFLSEPSCQSDEIVVKGVREKKVFRYSSSSIERFYFRADRYLIAVNRNTK
jgi:hypothetical protein